MNALTTDATRLRAAIADAILRLASLSDAIGPLPIYTTDQQADSAETCAEYVREVERITGELRVAFVEVAASLGNQHFGDADRDAIRNCDTVSDILSDAEDWIEETRVGELV